MFWERFYLLCENSSCKPLQVVKHLSIAAGSITNWKKGAIPNGDTLVKLANYFDCSVDYLVGRADSPKLSMASKEFSQLNAEGQKKVMEYISDLLTNPRYTYGKTIPFVPNDTEYVNIGRAVAFGGRSEESMLTEEQDREANKILSEILEEDNK